jgi:plasmid stabilization system protein ParE
MSLKVEWSEDSEADIKYIFEQVKEYTRSENLALNVVNDIYDTGTNINYVEQYQVDEYLGEPYRRMVVRQFKIIYIPVNENEIKILEVFNTNQSPNKMRD